MPCDLLFYDGGCGLCHRGVRFLVRRDRSGSRFRYAPLGGATFEQWYSLPERAGLPDSLVVRTPDGRTLVRAEAALHLGERLGWPWRPLARAARAIPRLALDRLYDAVAARRHRWWPRPADPCPVLAPELRDRFLP